MSGILVLGEEVRVRGFSLAGVAVTAADNPDQATQAWDELGDDIGLLILTPNAAEILQDRLDERSLLLWTVMPE